LIKPDGAEPGNEDINRKDQPIDGPESQVRAVSVPVNWHILRRFEEQVIELGRASSEIARRMNEKPKDQDHNKQYHRVNIIGDEGGAQAARDDIGPNNNWDQEVGGIDIHPGQGLDDLRATKDKTCTDQHVCCESVEEICDLGRLPVPGEDDLRKRVRARGIGLDIDRDEGEEEDLERPHGTIPHGPADAILIGERRARQEGSRPCPRGNNTRGDQTGFDRSGCRAELLGLRRREGRIAVLQPGESQHEQGEDSSDADDDAVSSPGGQDVEFVPRHAQHEISVFPGCKATWLSKRPLHG